RPLYLPAWNAAPALPRVLGRHGLVCWVGRMAGCPRAPDFFPAGVGGLGAAASGYQRPADENLCTHGGCDRNFHRPVPDGRPGLAAAGDWRSGHCRRCGVGARRDRPSHALAGESGDDRQLHIGRYCIWTHTVVSEVLTPPVPSQVPKLTIPTSEI